MDDQKTKPELLEDLKATGLIGDAEDFKGMTMDNITEVLTNFEKIILKERENAEQAVRQESQKEIQELQVTSEQRKEALAECSRRLQAAIEKRDLLKNENADLQQELTGLKSAVGVARSEKPNDENDPEVLIEGEGDLQDKIRDTQNKLNDQKVLRIRAQQEVSRLKNQVATYGSALLSLSQG